MPSLDELKVIYNNKSTLNTTLSAIGGTKFSAVDYWSSTENGSNYAYELYFSTGTTGSYSKGTSDTVRAVRAL